MYILISLISIFWLICGFVSWGFADGYVLDKCPRFRKFRLDISFLIYSLLLGPCMLISISWIFGYKHWTKRLWSKARKLGLDMVEKLEA
jgi:hypothetical protein